MIVKKVPDPKHSASVADRIRALTNYIVRPELTDPAEKCLYAGARGFICADLRDQQNEMIGLATAPRRASNPIIHYVLSWHEDEVPTSQDIEEAVDLFLGHLGLAECQAIYGLHVDTSNAHLHICVNRVDPVEEKLIRINGGFDLEAAHQAIAIIEEHQGWRREINARYVASGPNVYRSGWDAERPEISAAARDKELRTGEISAELKAHHVLKLALESAPNWAEFHSILGRAGMVYRKEGNGAIVIIDGVQVKASKALRAASWSKLVKHFGAYEEATVAPKADPYFTPWLDERREATCSIIGKGESNQSLGWHKVEGFEAYRIDGRTYYSRRRGGAVSFVDEGERIRVLASRDEEAARAALKLAAAKWPQGVSVEGSADFKRLMIRLAVEEGITIGNPELQADIKREQAIHRTKTVLFARQHDLKRAVAKMVEPLGAERYEVLVPGRTKAGEKARDARQVLASPDGRGFTASALAAAIHDALARGAKPPDINLAPRVIGRDYLWALLNEPADPKERPKLPGPARIAWHLPECSPLAIGSVRRSNRLALGCLAAELAEPGLHDKGNPSLALSRHALPLGFVNLERARIIAASDHDNSALANRLAAIAKDWDNAEASLSAIALSSRHCLRPPPTPATSNSGIQQSDHDSYTRLRALVIQDFPNDLRVHPSRIDAAIALRLRAMGRSPDEIQNIMMASAADHGRDTYVTPAIYAGRIRDFCWSTAAEQWLKDHQHLVEGWQAIAVGGAIKWPEPQAEPHLEDATIRSGTDAKVLAAVEHVRRRRLTAARARGQSKGPGKNEPLAGAPGASEHTQNSPNPAKLRLGSSANEDRGSESRSEQPQIGTAEDQRAPQKGNGGTAHASDFRAILQAGADGVGSEIELGGPLDQQPITSAANTLTKSGAEGPQLTNGTTEKTISTGQHRAEVRSTEKPNAKIIETKSSPPAAAPAAATGTPIREYSTPGPATSAASPPPSPPAPTESKTGGAAGGAVGSKATTESAPVRVIGREPVPAIAKPTEKPAPAGLTAPAKTQVPKPTERTTGPSIPQATEQHKDPASRVLDPHMAKRQGPGTDGSVQPKPDQDVEAAPAKHAEVNRGVPSPPPELSRASGPASASNARSAGTTPQPGPVSRQNQETTKAPGVAESSSPSSVAPKPGTPAPAPTPPPSGLPTVTPATKALPSAGPMAAASQKERPPLGNSTPTDPPSQGATPSNVGGQPQEPSLRELMKGLPREVPILLEASHRRGFDPGDDQPAQDPLAPVKRLVMSFPDCLVPTSPGNDETFEISHSLDVQKAVQTALAKGSAEAEKTKALIDKSVLAISRLIKPRWQELAKGSQCALYSSEPNSPLRALVRLWLDHRRALDQEDIRKRPDDAYRAHWVCHRVSKDLADLLPDGLLNPLSNWRGIQMRVGMTIIAELTLTARKLSAKTYADVLAAAHQEAGLIRASQAPSADDRAVFPPILPSDLRPDQRKALVLAARLDAHNQHTLTNKLLARDPVLRALHEFARQAIETTPSGPDRESLAVAIKATRQATLDRPFVEAILQPLGASPNLINRVLDQASNKGRQR
ncbi:LPD7 domain-containing protein [Rhabdaerophilum sp. SD176]|uniref:LPD7 domain-containing protein n=1 Tax=Rhabdaerophilum sp. SD176 TaxID=2983548 RepID=UPI0024DF504C|nr:LPD7 domain-containing protein [Rhabdaerophilum sp. SD176]